MVVLVLTVQFVFPFLLVKSAGIKAMLVELGACVRNSRHAARLSTRLHRVTKPYMSAVVCWKNTL